LKDQYATKLVWFNALLQGILGSWLSIWYYHHHSCFNNLIS
jgi:uncharacterized membrane protein YsdA (DUF1294 family)